MEISLFFCAILFLDLYLLAFTYISTKSYHFQDEKAVKVKYYIITSWVVSLLYHFALWLMSSEEMRTAYYQLGIAITLGSLIFTIGHFCFYFSTIKFNNKIYNTAMFLENRRQIFELLRGILYMYHLIRDIMDKDSEILQMMRWNQFDILLEEMADEAQPYVHTSSYNREDLEKLTGVKLWMENMLMIIEQHPNYKDVSKSTH